MTGIFAVELRRPDGIVLVTLMLPAESSLLYDLPAGRRPSGLVELWVGYGDRSGFQCLGEPFSFDEEPLMVSGKEIAAHLAWHSGLVGIRMEARA